MTKFIFLILLTSIFCSDAHAGIRVIYGGGGYSEMRALTALSRLNTLVSPCIMRPKLCGLGLTHTGFLKRAWVSGAFETGDSQLSFSLDNKEVAYNPIDDRQMILPSSRLYDAAGAPLTAREIGMQIFSAWMDRPSLAGIRTQTGIQVSDLYAIGEAVFGRTQVTEVALNLPTYKFHVLTISTTDFFYREVRVSMERDEFSVDITDSLLAQIPCWDLGKQQLTALNGLHEDGGRLHARATWRCAGATQQGRLIMTLDPETASLKVTVSGVQAQDCEINLRGNSK